MTRLSYGSIPRLGIGVLTLALLSPCPYFEVAGCPAAPLRSSPTVTREYASDARTPVAPGVVHDQGTIETDTAGRQAVHLLEVDMHNPAITMEASISNDRVAGVEKTSSQANRKSMEGHRAVAGINGDFWGTREAPIGLHIQAGELVTTPLGARPTFGIKSDGTPIIGMPTVNGAVTTINGSRFPIAQVNQARPLGATGQLFLYTPRFDLSTHTDSLGTEVVLSGIALPIGATGTYAGTVKQVRANAGDSPLGSDEAVLSGTGSAAGFLLTLSPGNRVSFTFSITQGWEAVRHAVGGGQFIVRNGMIDVSPRDPGFADVTHPRTAIGINAKGDLVMATVDGRQPGYSIGVRLDELGQVLRSRGAVTAINLDGGGSTTMAVRQPGDSIVTVVNRGSDGFERAVSNSLLVFSSAPPGPLTFIHVTPADATVLVGSHERYFASGQDAAFNPVPVQSEGVVWSVEGETATIDSTGQLSAIMPGKVVVRGAVGAISGGTGLTAVGTLQGMEIRPNPAIVAPGGTLMFTISGQAGNAKEVRIDSDRAIWSSRGPIGAIDSSGILKATAVSGTGSVTASAGGATATVRVDVGRPPEILEDFEDISDLQALGVRASAALTSAMRPDPVRSGTRSARLSYDFTVGEPGTSAAYAVHSPLRPIDGRPLAIGIWLYGDGSRHWVRGNYRDGTNAQKVIDFTRAPSPTPTTRLDCGRRDGGIEWIGWKYLGAPIPADAVLPLKWERVYVVETSDVCDNASAVYLDDLRAVYSDIGEDLLGPTVSTLMPEPDSTVSHPKPTIGATVRDNPGGSGVAADSIRLLIDDVQVPVTYDASTGLVRYTPAVPLHDGTHRVRLEATDHAGNPAMPFGDWTFRVRSGE